MLFDLRQNLGGDDTAARAYAQVLRENTAQYPDATAGDITSLYTAAGQANLYFLLWQEALANGQPADAYQKACQTYLTAYQELVDEGKTMKDRSVSTTAISGQSGTRKQAYSHDIVLLVDRV